MYLPIPTKHDGDLTMLIYKIFYKYVLRTPLINAQNCCELTGAVVQLVDTVLLQYCTEPCGQMLDCEHSCSGSCGQCRQGRLHSPCTEVCHVTTICGHQSVFAYNSCGVLAK